MHKEGRGVKTGRTEEEGRLWFKRIEENAEERRKEDQGHVEIAIKGEMRSKREGRIQEREKEVR